MHTWRLCSIPFCKTQLEMLPIRCIKYTKFLYFFFQIHLGRLWNNQYSSKSISTDEECKDTQIRWILQYKFSGKMYMKTFEMVAVCALLIHSRTSLYTGHWKLCILYVSGNSASVQVCIIFILCCCLLIIHCHYAYAPHIAPAHGICSDLATVQIWT